MNLMTIMLQAATGVAATDGVAAATETPSSPMGGSMQFLLMMVLIFGVMYFFMIRPQQKRQKELVKFRNSLEKGQKIITAGGIYGTVKEVKETYILIEIDNNVSIRIDKAMVMKDPSDLASQAK